MRPSLRRYLVLLLAGTPLAYGQGTISETRYFDQEVLTLDSSGFPQGFHEPLPLGWATDVSHGQIVEFEFDLLLEWDLRFEVTNNLAWTEEFLYHTWYYMYPSFGDCAHYDGHVLEQHYPAVDPGATVLFSIQEVDSVSWSGSSFDPGDCLWEWDSLWINSNLSCNCPKLTYGAGGQVPKDWIEVLSRQVKLTGSVSVRWEAPELPFTSVCAGSYAPGAGLTPYGTSENLWLVQSGVPNTFNLLLQAPTASSTVPANGLCVGRSGQGATRLLESLSVGGRNFRLPTGPSYSGTTQYLQSWFRTSQGTSRTGECIAIPFP